MQTTLIATCAFGLEAVVRRELNALGYEGTVVAPGWIAFPGDLSAVCRANLWLRTADRVLVRVGTFAAPDFDALFESTRQLPWHHWLDAEACFPVTGRSVKSQLSSVPACQRTVKKAIVESLRASYQVGELPERGPQYRVEVALHSDVATLTLDTTGPGLHRRGYATTSLRGQLKETLAAALVLLSFWRPERPLMDPFCGAGAIPIEAALIGRNMAPGRYRSFVAESWPVISERLWKEARAESQDLTAPAFQERLVGTDQHDRLLTVARRHAEQAGVSEQVHFQQRPFRSLTSKKVFGCVVTNAPSAQRAEDARELEALYLSLPEILRRLPTWSHFILTDYPRFESLIQKTADRRRKLYVGRQECTYYQFHGPRPDRRGVDQVVPTHRPIDTPPAGVADEADSSTAAGPDPRTSPSPVFGGVTVKGREQADLFRSRLIKLARHLRRWPSRQGITCYRLYDRDIPEVPLVVDRYEDHLHVTEYERPHDRDRAQHADWLDLMVRTAGEALGIERQRIFLKRRERQRGARQHEHLAQTQYEITVREGELQFIVNLSDYVDTGLFLDHRITRSMVREQSRDSHVLNLFGYTGTFSVYAAHGGAASTTTVDWSRAYLEWAQRNMELNGYSGPPYRFVRQDARQFLCQLEQGRKYDLAVVDPPTFSNSKRTDEDWDIQRDYAELLSDLMPHMRPGGLIFFSTNFRRFKFDAAQVPGAEVFEISRQTVPADFRNRRIHRCWKMLVHR